MLENYGKLGMVVREVVGEKMPQIEKGSNKVLIPVDFSSYSLKACEFGFNFAKNIDAEVVCFMYILHLSMRLHCHTVMFLTIS